MEIGNQSIAEIWKAIADELLRKNQGKRLDYMLLPPALGTDIAIFESEIGTSLPTDYKASLYTYEGTVFWVWLWDAVTIPSISEVIHDWKLNLKEANHPNSRNAELLPYGPVRRCIFDSLWIPVANDNGIPICLDLNPLPEGSMGQMIYVDWEDGTVRVIAKSFTEFLKIGLGKMRNS